MIICDHCLLEAKRGPSQMRWVPSARCHECLHSGCDRVFDLRKGYSHRLTPGENPNLRKCTCIDEGAMYIELKSGTYRYRCAVVECANKGPVIREPLVGVHS